MNNTTEAYTYDAVGNRLSTVSDSGWSYDSSNHLTARPGVTYTYDNNGNTATKVDSNGTTTYAWDYLNRLTSVTLPGGGGTVTFKYDPFGRRIQKVSPTGTTNYLYDGANSIEEVDATGTILARYAQGAGVDEPLDVAISSGTKFYQADGLGSITALADISGSATDAYVTDTFGKATSSAGTTRNPFHYTARELDSETGLYYYRARYYDSAIGRFISEDPSLSGVDLYAYVTNNPTVFMDPSGLTNCTKTALGLVCYKDNHPGTVTFDPKLPEVPQPAGLPKAPTPVPMPSTFCKPGTDCHDSMTPLPTATYGNNTLDPCRGWSPDDFTPLPYKGPFFQCQGNRDQCIDAEVNFLNACEKAGCTGRPMNTLFNGIGAACCVKPPKAPEYEAPPKPRNRNR